MNNFYVGHKSKNCYFFKFNSGSASVSGSFAASSSVSAGQLNQIVGQNTEFLFGASSQVRLNLSRVRNPLIADTLFQSQSFAFSFGPFPVTLLPDGRSAPLFVSMDCLPIGFTASVLVHLRQEQNEIGAFFAPTDHGSKEVSGNTSQYLTFTVVSSSFSSSYLEIPADQTRTKQFYSYSSRSVDAPKDSTQELICYLDVYLTGLLPDYSKVTGSFQLTRLYAQEVIPRVSGSY
jgi:hypothetical protein